MEETDVPLLYIKPMPFSPVVNQPKLIEATHSVTPPPLKASGNIFPLQIDSLRNPPVLSFFVNPRDTHSGEYHPTGPRVKCEDCP